jgi:CRISPR/Cas system-associated exonuclease Cas4 (RecB family)
MQGDGDRDRVIRASKVGLYAYCARAWWLDRVRGYRPANRAALQAGEAAHQAHGRAVVGYHRLRQAAYLLLGLAALLGLILLVAALLK